MSQVEPENVGDVQFWFANELTDADPVIAKGLVQHAYGGAGHCGGDGVSAYDRESSDQVAYWMKLSDDWREGEEISFVNIAPEQDIQGMIDSDVAIRTFSSDVLDPETGECQTEIQNHIVDFGWLPEAVAAESMPLDDSEEFEGHESSDVKTDTPAGKDRPCEGRTRDSWYKRDISIDHPEDGTEV